MPPTDEKYLKLITDAVAVCAEYRPKFGQGRKAGLTLAQFQELYESDEFYSWFGLSSPLMYAAHKAAGGMTSIYRQIGIGCQWVFTAVLQDLLGLSTEAASWSYTVKARGKKLRRLSLDGRIPVHQIGHAGARQRVEKWLDAACRQIGLPNRTRQILRGSVFEVRQGYIRAKTRSGKTPTLPTPRMLTPINICQWCCCFLRKLMVTWPSVTSAPVGCFFVV